MKRLSFILLLGWFVPFCLFARDLSTSSEQVNYVDTTYNIDCNFIINTTRFINNADSIQTPVIDLSADTVIRVDITGRASIDGPESFNDRLAADRAKRMEKIILDSYPVDPENVFTSSIGEDWQAFRELVASDINIPGGSEVLQIIDSNLSNAAKEKKIRALWKGITWKYLRKYTLPLMRDAGVSMVIRKMLPAPEPEPEIIVEELQNDTIQEPEIVEIIEEVVPLLPVEEWYRKMYIKTNAPAWALLLQNLAVEVDLAKHWSVALPVYWSPYDYGKQTLKFRTLALIPEIRYWTKPENMGFFVNAHFGMAYFNYAKNGEYRYQDHNGTTPALGGGLGIGYRFYFCKNHRWSMEAMIGAGVYHLDYDIFQNTPSTKNGMLIGRRSRTFYGIDQAAFSFSYSFGLSKPKTK